MKPSRQRLPLLEKTLKPEPTPRKIKADEPSANKNSGFVVKYSPPSSSSHRTESPASIITFACSTLERCMFFLQFKVNFSFLKLWLVGMELG